MSLSKQSVDPAHRGRRNRADKRRLRKVPFCKGLTIFRCYTITIEDDRKDYGEERFVTFGMMEGRVVAVVHTERGDSIRIISIRKATKYEQKTYFLQISDRLETC